MGFGALKSRIAHFKEDLRGTILVEFVIISPVFIMLIAMGFEFFDAFKSYNRAQKASYPSPIWSPAIRNSATAICK